jgi:hypothetical protein
MPRASNTCCRSFTLAALREAAYVHARGPIHVYRYLHDEVFPKNRVATSVHLTDIGPIPGTVFTVEGDHRREP